MKRMKVLVGQGGKMKASDSINKVAETFGRAFGMEVYVIEAEERDDCFDKIQSGFCTVCKEAQIRKYGKINCSTQHAYACYQSERWGGKYEYLCSIGLTFVCTAVQSSGKTEYYLLAGPFLMYDMDDFIAENFEQFLDGVISAELIIRAKGIQQIELNRVTSMSNILFMLGAYCAERDMAELRLMEGIANAKSELFHSIVDEGWDSSEYDAYQIMAEKRLRSYIATGDKASAQRTINEILEYLYFKSGNNFNVIKARAIELSVVLSRAAIEAGADATEIFGVNSDYLNRISNFEEVEQLSEWLAIMLSRFTKTVFDASKMKHSELITQIVDYIRNNYMNKITLNDIAEKVNFSVSYISKIFKEETDMNLVTFINNVRIEKSKLLLLDKTIPLIEIAYMSGFDDQSYFSKVFKKIVGVTPGKYRERNGNIEELKSMA
ncbi:MAG: helix-turn-helix domain-containing protein [Christensenellales bacterium]|jgi:two-component system response regulator YesN